MMSWKPLFAMVVLVTPSLGHGIITTPPVRAVGQASRAACGSVITDILKADNQSGIETLYSASGTDPDFKTASCNLVLCKGLQLEDNLANVQIYHPGQEINIKVWTRIPHKGWASVAVMDTRTSPVPLIIGEPLISFETDSATGFSTATAPVDMDFNVTLPDSLYGRCTEPGHCVLQWTWFGRVVHQTYESCIDFVMAEDKAPNRLHNTDEKSEGQLRMSGPPHGRLLRLDPGPVPRD